MLPIAAAGGLALPTETISGDSGRMLVTFLGLVSASILPTVSLLVNSMTASGRSVEAINKLEAELQSAIDALFLLFGCVGIVIGALVALSTPPPWPLTAVPFLTTEALPRVGQQPLRCFRINYVIWQRRFDHGCDRAHDVDQSRVDFSGRDDF